MDLFGFSYSGQQEILTLQTTKKQANIRLIAIEMHRNRKNQNGQRLSRIFSVEKTQHLPIKLPFTFLHNTTYM
jgi:hypothetical protein